MQTSWQFTAVAGQLLVSTQERLLLDQAKKGQGSFHSESFRLLQARDARHALDRYAAEEANFCCIMRAKLPRGDLLQVWSGITMTLLLSQKHPVATLFLMSIRAIAVKAARVRIHRIIPWTAGNASGVGSFKSRSCM